MAWGELWPRCRRVWFQSPGSVWESEGRDHVYMGLGLVLTSSPWLLQWNLLQTWNLHWWPWWRPGYVLSILLSGLPQTDHFRSPWQKPILTDLSPTFLERQMTHVKKKWIKNGKRETERGGRISELSSPVSLLYIDVKDIQVRICNLIYNPRHKGLKDLPAWRQEYVTLRLSKHYIKHTRVLF